MVIGTALFIVVAVVAAIWIFIEVKRLKHKLFAIFLIALILFSYISFSVVLKNENIDYKSISGWTEMSSIYFSWLSTVFSNFKSITTYAIKKDWSSVNESEGKIGVD